MDEERVERAATRRDWAALAVLLLGALMGFLDIFVVNVAVPSIQADLHATFADIQLVPAGYTLAYAIGLVTGGRLGDLLGRKRVFLAGVVAFAATSTACAVALTPEDLVRSRIAQGLAAALMLPQVLALVRTTFTRPAEQGRAIGWYGAVIGVGVVGGQILGGLLVRLDVAGLGWRPIFLVNVPLCALTFVGALVLVRDGAPRQRVRLDLVGAALLALALFGLLHPLVVGAERGWSSWLVAEAALAVALLAGFALWERSVAARGGAALLPPRLFRQPGFARGLPAALFFYGVNGAFVFVLAFYLQRTLGLSPLRAALAFTPMALATSLAAIPARRWTARFGTVVVPVSATVMALGLAALWVVVRYVPVSAQAVAAQPGLVLYGLGGGVVATSLIGMTLSGVSPEDSGAASGGVLTVVQASEAVGVAGVGALFTTLVAANGEVRGFGMTLLVLTALSLVGALLLNTLRTARIS
ncbi:MFS transporter [Streptoalloteichus tenebrarius]|uniref:MFS transporter n=1 Tax=Streptoalloteichus tenebrarius (strain ATCC 17920 / DSM 40477 / JCM 4838 / CBS 697.72 / NBRC 16177 / NCIMB 11028 / NRRL B-12390 / A12253. 1 / ISP 5477) TaxID=1933 RepID=UPI0020A2C0EE|nr:MFS transporter [Streptoalloteichus tenebrarius]